MPRSTLIRPPPVDTSKSWMENMLELTPLPDVGPDIFSNTRELWKAPGARGIYGGTVIAQTLLAAFHTVPEPSPANKNAVFLPHSMHCYFILAGDPSIPIVYYVERVREGRSFLTRTVQARQRGKCIFTTTISFVSEGSGGKQFLQHGFDMPNNALDKLQERLEEEQRDEKDREAKSAGLSVADTVEKWPFTSKTLGIHNNSSPYPQLRRPQSWLKCNETIAGDVRDHLCALAYMSDSYFIGAVSRIHGLERFAAHATSTNPYFRRLAQEEMIVHESNGGRLRAEDREGGLSPNTPTKQPEGRIGMMVSLDHVIYFHHPRAVKADDWIFTEIEVPWSGEGRGLVTERMWNQDGKLLASCVQEGLVRLQAKESKL